MFDFFCLIIGAWPQDDIDRYEMTADVIFLLLQYKASRFLLETLINSGLEERGLSNIDILCLHCYVYDCSIAYCYCNQLLHSFISNYTCLL